MGVFAGEGASTELDREPSTTELGLNPRGSHRSLSRWWGLSDLWASRGPVANGTSLEGQMGLAMPPTPPPPCWASSPRKSCLLIVGNVRRVCNQLLKEEPELHFCSLCAFEFILNLSETFAASLTVALTTCPLTQQSSAPRWCPGAGLPVGWGQCPSCDPSAPCSLPGC